MQFAIKRFERSHGQLGNVCKEIEVMKSISHPKLVCLIEVFQDMDGVSLILEYAPGGEFFHLTVASGKLAEDDAWKVCSVV